MSAEAKLVAMGLKLPEVPEPVASYVNAVRTGNLMVLSGGLPFDPERKFNGSVPSNVLSRCVQSVKSSTTSRPSSSAGVTASKSVWPSIQVMRPAKKKNVADSVSARAISGASPSGAVAKVSPSPA